MNRSYSRDHYLRLVDQIRQTIPDVAISTDLIVGFPGETVQDFEDTLDLMERVRYDAAFMFKYSERPGTKAALLADDVREEEKDRRLQAMITLQREHTLAQNQRHIGKEESILVEGFSRKTDAEMMGRTTHNKIVIFPAKDYQPKQLIHRRITDARGVTLFAMEK
jgi:tRNA-2-methylthio-N6-dimethylallyladenosine synthase